MKFNYLREYFYFTRLERNASVALAILCLFFLGLPLLFRFFLQQEPATDFSAFKADIIAFQEKDTIQSLPPFKSKPVTRVAPGTAPDSERFDFDPNTVSREDLQRLGLPSRVVNNLLAYRSKGGHFRKKEDLLRIYGFRESDFSSLEPYIRIADRPSVQPKNFPVDSIRSRNEPRIAFDSATKTGKSPFIRIDINQSTAADWEKLKGIGPAYARRIVGFRDKLGGFLSVSQIGETYGLPDSTFRMIRPFLDLSPVLRKIRVNAAGESELAAHPYISFFQARILVNYRHQHGPFAGMESLLGIREGFTSSDWERLQGYLDFQ